LPGEPWRSPGVNRGHVVAESVQQIKRNHRSVDGIRDALLDGTDAAIDGAGKCDTRRLRRHLGLRPGKAAELTETRIEISGGVDVGAARNVGCERNRATRNARSLAQECLWPHAEIAACAQFGSWSASH
jgi:hypothetical protein